MFCVAMECVCVCLSGKLHLYDSVSVCVFNKEVHIITFFSPFTCACVCLCVCVQHDNLSVYVVRGLNR